MSDSNPTDLAAQGESALPLIVAVTGHRDLLASEIPNIRAPVKDLLVWLTDQYPDRRLCVMSPLAEGADRLVAEEALALGINLNVPLPMPRAMYLEDFDIAESREQFEILCARV